jgi:penicillin amidase
VKSEAREFEVRKTRNGPLFYLNESETRVTLGKATSGTYVSVRSVLDRISPKENKTFVGYMKAIKATNIQEFREGLSDVSILFLNILYADNKGNIGSQAIGRVPIREREGNYPLDGWDDKQLWQGFIPFEEMPYVINPPKGYIINCNNIPTSEQYKWYNSFGKEYKSGRINRAW